MPIELLYTDTEIIQMQKDILLKIVMSPEDMEQLREINAYFETV